MEYIGVVPGARLRASCCMPITLQCVQQRLVVEGEAFLVSKHSPILGNALILLGMQHHRTRTNPSQGACVCHNKLIDSDHPIPRHPGLSYPS